MINRIFFLYYLAACSEYQLTEKKNIDELNNILTKLEPYYLELEKFYERRRK